MKITPPTQGRVTPEAHTEVHVCSLKDVKQIPVYWELVPLPPPTGRAIIYYQIVQSKTPMETSLNGLSSKAMVKF